MLNHSFHKVRIAYQVNINHGYTLLEILIALSILSVSLLGLAEMQLLSLRNTHAASLQCLAQVNVLSLAETLQACTAINCAPATLQHELAIWNQSNTYNLPRGAGQLLQQAGYKQIVLTWSDNVTGQMHSTIQLTVANLHDQ